jgi:hypothetical protein
LLLIASTRRDEKDQVIGEVTALVDDSWSVFAGKSRDASSLALDV